MDWDGHYISPYVERGGSKNVKKRYLCFYHL